MSKTVTAVAHPNLAVVKYWGKADPRLNIPTNSSLSVNLGSARTTTAVCFSPDFEQDIVHLNGAPADERTAARVTRHLDRVRRLAGRTERARVESVNDFPAAAGIASSASAFAALSLAASRALDLHLTERELSVLARQGSGSACRSIPSGFVRWEAGHDDASSYACQVAPPEHWDLRITTVIFSEQPKEVSSSDGHALAQTSPFFAARLAELPHTLEVVQSALLARDFARFGLALEREAVSMHTIAMTADASTSGPLSGPLSGLYYWQAWTMGLIQRVQAWRRGGLPVYFTIDAGPNVHLFCEAAQQAAVEAELAGVLPAMQARTIVSAPARGAWVVSEA
jgi:diphosphomevalonate decarboxylase